jgi:hypothetical protein
MKVLLGIALGLLLLLLVTPVAKADGIFLGEVVLTEVFPVPDGVIPGQIEFLAEVIDIMPTGYDV